MTGKPLDPEAVRKIEKEFGVGSFQNWKTSVSGGLVFQSFNKQDYKENKSVSFAYEP